MANQEKSTAELYREERKKRIAKAAKRNSKKHMSDKTQKSIVTTVVILILVAIAGVITGGIVNNIGVFERNKVIMTVGENEIDKYEYAYYYNTSLQQVALQAAQLDMYYGAGMGAMYTGYDYSKTPSEQAYSGEIEGIENPTFADYFKKSAVDFIKYVKGSVAYAEANNITLDEADYKTIDETFAQLDQNRTNSDGTKYSLAAYLRLSYGKGMTEKLFRRIMEEQTLAQKVMQVKQDEFKAAYTSEEIENAFNEGIDNYGYVSLRSYTFTIDAAAEDSKPTDEEKASAKSDAEEIAANVTDEESFKKLVSEYEESRGGENAADFLTDDTLTLVEDSTLSQYSSDEAVYEWVKTAKAGDTYVQATDSNCTVYLMVNPLHKASDEKTYDVRHILVKFPEAEDETVTDGDAKKEVEVKELNVADYDVTVVNNVKEPITDVESYNKAVEILTSYLEGDKTEDAFAALAVAHSADSNAADGGIYEDVAVGKMVSEFENWSLDADRKVGDVGIVETTYGYHIMYHVGVNVTTWEDVIKNDLATEEYNAFYEDLINGENVVAGEADAAMLKELDADIDELAKNIYRNYQSQTSSLGY